MDEIRIENLKVFAHHGVFPEENEKGQNFYVNAVLYMNTAKAGTTDDLTLSVHYGEVCHLITKCLQEHTWKLLERVAEVTAANILTTYPLIKGLELEIRKPEAPIGLPFESVSVKIRRQWHKVYIAFGSNLGNREEHLRAGLDILKNRPEIRNYRESGFYYTEPYGETALYEFINGVAEIETYLEPETLLDVLHEIENTRKRTREIHWGPRTLDLDILLYDDRIMDEAALVIPHKDMHNRDFVLQPMVELAPDKRHPIYGSTMEELWQQWQENHVPPKDNN